MSSKCKACGEQITSTGNYTVRILPAKRIPKKARKLMKKGDTTHDSSQGGSSLVGTTSFHKFLMKRSQPANFLELTCGKCGSKTRMKLLKNRKMAEDNLTDKRQHSSTDVDLKPTPTSGKKKRKNKDITAGLTLPPSSGGGVAPGSSTVVNIQSKNVSSTSTPPNPASKSSTKRTAASAFQKKREMDNLKKVLFESKRAKKSGSSLQDFLSGI